MELEKFTHTEKPMQLLKAVEKHFNTTQNSIGYNTLMKAFRNKDIKVNGIRAKENILLNVGDEVEVYFSKRKKDYSSFVVYSDDNIIVLNKPARVECNEALAEDLEAILVHRLDYNTEGLLVLAKNITAEKELTKAFKDRIVDKYYVAEVVGHLQKEADTLTAYLKKDSEKSEVLISSKPLNGYVKIITAFRVLERRDNSDLLEIKLVSGKTHQIRAHFAHLGHPVVGDGKYGRNKDNKIFGKSRQQLKANKLVFHFAKTSPLAYLDGKTIEIN